MKVTITGLPDDMTMQELATRCRLYRKYGYAAEVEPIEPEQSEKPLLTIGDVTNRVVGNKFRIGTIEEHNEKPLHTQAAEILGHIHNKDYGLAESKAGLLRDQLQKGDWTLGAGTETEPTDDGFVRMRCDGIIDNVHISNTALSVAQIKFLYGRTGESSDYGDHAALLRILEIVNRLNGSDARKDVRAIKSMKSIDRIITEWSAQRDDGIVPIKYGVCAFCGSDEPSIICDGKLFCDMKCANNYTNKDTLIKDFEAKIRSIRNAWLISCDDVNAMKSDRDIWEQEAHRLIERLETKLSTCEQDSEVLRQVVEVVKNYDDSKWQGYNTMHKIVDLLVDYIEVPEARAG